jgi:hypothetical protein
MSDDCGFGNGEFGEDSNGYGPGYGYGCGKDTVLDPHNHNGYYTDNFGYGNGSTHGNGNDTEEYTGRGCGENDSNGSISLLGTGSGKPLHEGKP